MIHVLLFIPADDPHLRKWLVTLWVYCMRRRYKPEAIVHEWADVRRLMLQGVAQKVVVAVRDHAEWLEVVSEMPEQDEAADPPGARRVQRRRWAKDR